MITIPAKIKQKTEKEFTSIGGKNLKTLPKKKKKKLLKTLSNLQKNIAKCCPTECDKPKFKRMEIEEAESGWIVSSYQTGDKIIATNFKGVLNALKKITSKDITRSMSKSLPKQIKIKFKKPIMKKLLEIAQRRQDQFLQHVGNKQNG